MYLLTISSIPFFSNEVLYTVLKNDPIYVEMSHLKEYMPSIGFALEEELIQKPSLVIGCLRLAFAQVFCQFVETRNSTLNNPISTSAEEAVIDLEEIDPKFIVRIYGWMQRVWGKF